MTLNQLQSLTEDELCLALYVVNNISPAVIPPPPYGPYDLTWWKHNALVQKLVDAFPNLKPEGHSIFLSLMAKLGVNNLEIKQMPVPEPPPISTPNPESEQKTDMPETINQMPTGSV